MKKLLAFLLFTLTGVLILLKQDAFSQTTVPEASTAPIVSSSADPRKITLDIKGMDIVDVIKMLSGKVGLNVIVGKNVSGKVTLFIKDVDAWEAFEFVLVSNDLAYDRRGDMVNVMSQRDYELLYGERFQDKKRAKIIQLKYAKAADISRALTQMKTNIGKVIADDVSNTLVIIDTPIKLIEMAEFVKNADVPIETRIFNLNYAQAEKISSKLQDSLTKGLGVVKIDERTNKIAVTDTVQKLDEIAKVIAAFDEKTQQVLIDAQIIEVKPSDKLEVGFDWDYWFQKYMDIKAALPINTTGALLVGTASTVTKPGDYKATMDIIRTIGDVKILSSPRIMALNNQEAKILVGTKDAYITSTTVQSSGSPSSISQTVNFVDVGIKLFVTPTISRDGFITMKIRPEISSAIRTDITSEGTITQVPIVSTSESETTVMIRDGVTIVIGGLRKDSRDKTVKKIPLFGDIPLIGHFFRRISDDSTTSDLIILLTPHIMSGESSFTEFKEIAPKQGAVASMKNGNIVIEKIPADIKEDPRALKIKQLQAKKEARLKQMQEARDKKTQELSGQQERDKQAKLKEQKKQILDNQAAQEAEKATYYQNLINRIQGFAKRNSPVGVNGNVVVNFLLSSNGQLLAEPNIISSSEDSLVPYALKVIKDAIPFPVFPTGINKTEERFTVTISYK
ncbi:MAG: hypothetical protein MUF05_02770 [Candidatus Omnitrophica bacterium]|jgi:type II secretory pathway component GspD/PulD (secretin)|nr:hypothetical protein [Candidatus Omnitrophota bacterium]